MRWRCFQFRDKHSPPHLTHRDRKYILKPFPTFYPPPLLFNLRKILMVAPSLAYVLSVCQNSQNETKMGFFSQFEIGDAQILLSPQSLLPGFLAHPEFFSKLMCDVVIPTALHNCKKGHREGWFMYRE